MRKKLLYIFLLVTLEICVYSCAHRSEADYYSEQNYKKVNSIYYDDNKSLKEEMFVFNSDTSRTLIKSYYESGNLRAITFYLDKKKDGPWNFYEDNGKKSFEGFFKGGLKDSIHKIFHDNGKLYILERYHMGEKYGDWLYYDSLNGNIIKTEKYPQ